MSNPVCFLTSPNQTLFHLPLASKAMDYDVDNTVNHRIKQLQILDLPSFNPLFPRSDEHITSPNDIHTLFSKKGNENTQTYQIEVVILI